MVLSLQGLLYAVFVEHICLCYPLSHKASIRTAWRPKHMELQHHPLLKEDKKPLSHTGILS